MDSNRESVIAGILEPSLPPGIECFNSEGFEFFLTRELAESMRYAYFSAFSLFRVNGVEDGEGLERLARCLTRNVRKTDFVGRVDQDTIGIILQHATVDSAAQVLERLKRELINVFGGRHIETIRDAVAVFPTEANTLEALKDLAWSRLTADETASEQAS